MTIHIVQDRETIDPVSVSVGFTSTKLTTNTLYAVIQAINGNIRFAIDGSTPIATGATALGMRLLQDASLEIWGKEAMTNFRCIDDGGTAKLEVVYMGP